MAEIEIGVLARQCLDCQSRHEVNAWQNATGMFDWRFTTEDGIAKVR